MREFSWRPPRDGVSERSSSAARIAMFHSSQPIDEMIHSAWITSLLYFFIFLFFIFEKKKEKIVFSLPPPHLRYLFTYTLHTDTPKKKEEEAWSKYAWLALMRLSSGILYCLSAFKLASKRAVPPSFVCVSANGRDDVDLSKNLVPARTALYIYIYIYSPRLWAFWWSRHTQKLNLLKQSHFVLKLIPNYARSAVPILKPQKMYIRI